jgi:hypothetical protein
VITEEGKQRARIHMGYQSVQSSQTFVMGVPAGVQTQFMIEGAWARILPQAEADFYKLLDRMDRTLERIEESEENEEADAIGDIRLKDKAFVKLVKRYLWWQGMLANLLGVMPNPFDQRFVSWGGNSGGGVNLPVRH